MPRRPSLLSLVFCGGALLISVPAMVTATIYTALLQQGGEQPAVRRVKNSRRNEFRAVGPPALWSLDGCSAVR